MNFVDRVKFALSGDEGATALEWVGIIAVVVLVLAAVYWIGRIIMDTIESSGNAIENQTSDLEDGAGRWD